MKITLIDPAGKLHHDLNVAAIRIETDDSRNIATRIHRGQEENLDGTKINPTNAFTWIFSEADAPVNFDEEGNIHWTMDKSQQSDKEADQGLTGEELNQLFLEAAAEINRQSTGQQVHCAKWHQLSGVEKLVNNMVAEKIEARYKCKPNEVITPQNAVQKVRDLDKAQAEKARQAQQAAPSLDISPEMYKRVQDFLKKHPEFTKGSANNLENTPNTGRCFKDAQGGWYIMDRYDRVLGPYYE